MAGYSQTAHSYLKSNFIWAVMFVLTLLKPISQILRNDVIDNINKFNLATVFVSIKCIYAKNITSRILSAQVTFFSSPDPTQRVR
jgi:hypothetical protein